MSLHIESMISSTNPADQAYEKEYSDMFLRFCSYVCIVKNKKMNLPNIFLWMLKDEQLREVFKNLCDVETDYDVLNCFLKYDSNLYRSKYIRNFLIANPELNLKW